MFNVSVHARGVCKLLWQQVVSCGKKEAKILKEKQTANRPFLPSVAPPFFPSRPSYRPGTRIQFLSFNKLGEKLKRMLAAE